MVTGFAALSWFLIDEINHKYQQHCCHHYYHHHHHDDDDDHHHHDDDDDDDHHHHHHHMIMIRGWAALSRLLIDQIGGWT